MRFLSPAACLLALHHAAHGHALPKHGTQATNNTVDSKVLKTWWHATGEINTKTPVRPENVRQSHLYNVQVAAASAPTSFYDSFVYESIPRNGNGPICKPGDLTSICDVDDQINIEPDIGVDMSWTQYLTSQDTIVRITRKDGGSVDASNVEIRPQTLGFKIKRDGNAVLITVPFSQDGYRFSVEFKDNLWEYRANLPTSGTGYVQNKNPNGKNYVKSYNNQNNPIVGIEPLNALLIFMSPFPDSQYIPDLTKDTYKVPQGLVTGLDKVTQKVLYFPPGVYWFTGSAHAILSKSITWVYIAPGAYVKGAIEYESDELDLRATGFGVLSGEQYVYQANTAQNYENVKSDDSSLKMWRGESAVGAKWTIHGLTTNAPPFNSMDFYGDDLNSFSVDASDYKQVGAFFGQTDGMEMYPGSHVRNVFYHVGDDGIKTYYSNILCEKMTVWKTNNAPIVQFGWYGRDTTNVIVDNVQVIHTRYFRQETIWPRALVASAASYLDQDSTSTADVTKTLSDYHVTNWRCEGVCPALLGINPLNNIDNLVFENVYVDKLGPPSTEIGLSRFAVFTDADHGNQSIALGNNSKDNLGLVIENFVVGDEKISFAANNWQSNALGQLNIDGHWQGRWTVR
ncbi:glycoside hydrolase [Mariannaea sp. PMI_226]|nr:glycoside hydrolase [Mariannaea sp. PMI_226]